MLIGNDDMKFVGQTFQSAILFRIEGRLESLPHSLHLTGIIPSSAGAMLAIGDTYLDYTVDAYIGRGGMGTVLRLQKPDGERAALKILHPHLLDDEELVRRFYLEAEVAGRIDTPRVCRVYDVRRISLGEDESHAILMEYVEGESLADMIIYGDAYGEEWALHVADGVLEALEAIHEAGLLHRDIKPENIIITPEDTVKVLDLGLAKVVESSIKLSKTGYFIGTYHYASPEQLTGDDLDFSCDIYSLGTVLYELTTAARPHTSDDIRELIYEKVNVPVRSPSRLNPTLTPFFDMLVSDMLAIKSTNRPGTASQVRQIISEREKSDWYRTKVSISISRESLSSLSGLRRLVRVPRRTKLYGRNDEQDRLRGFAQVSLGFTPADEEEDVDQGGVVFIGGEAGIGKTRLVEELVTELESNDLMHVILLGRSLQEKRHVPYGPLIEMVRDFFLLEDEPEVDLVELFGEYLPNLRPLIPPFLELVTHKRFLNDSDIRGVLNESNLLHLFQTLFTTIAKEVPLILFLDDLQWADVNTIGVLSYLVSGLGDAPLLILGTYRDEELESADGESHPLTGALARFSGKPLAEKIKLERLNRPACHGIIAECFPGSEFVEDLTDRVYEKSEGNPFFIMEILNLLFDEGKVGFRGGRWEMMGESSAIEIPPSLRDIVAYRLDMLSDEEREVLEAASILGYRFTSALLGELIEIQRIKLLRTLQKLEKNRRLILSFEAGYRFDHHVVYETVYDGILSELKLEYHRLASDILADRDEIQPVVYELVYHLRRAGEDEKLLKYLPVAFDRARSEYSNRLALNHSEWAWDAYERLGQPEKYRETVAGLMGQRGEVAGILGERETELESANRMLDLAGQLDDSALISTAHRLLGEYSRNISEWDQALENYSIALEKCLEPTGFDCAAILRHMGAVYYLKGDTKKAIEHYHKALEAIDDFPEGTEHVKTHNNLGISLKRIGHLEAAKFEFERAQTIAEEIGELHAETFPLGSLALINYDSGQWEKAQELFVKLLGILEQTGDMVSRARTLLNTGNIFYQVGQYEQAGEYFEESLAARRRMDDRMGEATVLHHLAHIDCERGEHDRALERLTEALVIHEEIGASRGEAGTLAVMARANNNAGRHKVALECALKALEIGEAEGFTSRLIEARMELLIARLNLGESKEKIAEEVRSLSDEAGMEILKKLGTRAVIRLGELQADCGLIDEANASTLVAREIVQGNLENLTDPEWRASYKYLYQGILT